MQSCHKPSPNNEMEKGWGHSMGGPSPRRTSSSSVIDGPYSTSQQLPPVEEAMPQVRGSSTSSRTENGSGSSDSRGFNFDSMPAAPYRPAGRGDFTSNMPNSYISPVYEESKEGDMFEPSANGRTLQAGNRNGFKSSPTHVNVPAGYEQFAYYSNPLPLTHSSRTAGFSRSRSGRVPSSASTRSSHNTRRNSGIQRRDVYSKGIDLRNLDHPALRKDVEARNAAAEDSPADRCQQAISSTVSVLERRNSAPVCLETDYAPKPSQKDVHAAASRLRDLCMRINEDGYLPERSEIKEVVTDYHRSHQQPLSPSDPNFVAIPNEYSKVLANGLARSQQIQVEDNNKNSPLHSTVVVESKEDEVSCLSAPVSTNNKAEDSSSDSFQHGVSSMTIGVLDRRNSAPSCLLNSNYTPEPSLKALDAVAVATSRLRPRDLCKKIKDDGYVPQRSEIKEAVADYHLSRHQPLKASDPNFVAIPYEYSKVLTYGLALTQCVSQVPVANADTTSESDEGVNASASQSQAPSKIKNEAEQHDKDSPLHATIVLRGCNEDEVSCLRP